MARLPVNVKGSGQSSFGDNTWYFNPPGIITIKTGESTNDVTLKFSP